MNFYTVYVIFLIVIFVLLFLLILYAYLYEDTNECLNNQKKCAGSLSEFKSNVLKSRTDNHNFNFTIALLVISSTDRSEDIYEIKKKLGDMLVDTEQTDDYNTAKKYISQWVIDGIQCIIVKGGTGISKNDFTPELIKDVIDKEISGYGELLRSITYEKWRIYKDQIGVLAMDTRAIAGSKNKSIIYSTSGEPEALNLALDEIIFPGTSHLLHQLSKEQD